MIVRHRRLACFIPLVLALTLGAAGSASATTKTAGAEASFYSQQSAIDTAYVYWVRTFYSGDPFLGNYKSRDSVVQHNLITGTERTIFAAARGEISGLAASAGRVTFSVRDESTNRRKRKVMRLDRIYAMDEDASTPTRLATRGGTLHGARTRSVWDTLCLGFGYDLGIDELGTVYSLEQRNSCSSGHSLFTPHYATYARDGTRAFLKLRDSGTSGTALHGGKLYSFDEIPLQSTDTASGVVVKSPIDAWIDALDFEGSRAVAIIAEDDDSNRPGFYWFDPVTMMPIRRVKSQPDELIYPQLCTSGYVVVTGRRRSVKTNKNWQQSLGKGPHAAKFYDYNDRPLRTVKLPNKGIDNLDCAGDNLILFMDGSKRPAIKVVPFG